ncbi:uncharacterized protein LOC123696453 isoform X1 [Colias croceus]|uniref:uncharacterized protein LOC123696453 isoform X1 n=1 Tax=Colias crocea TaxID=72248 RepID=UPI001E27D616|nr:uncharacterized protein LOC123696453 isoform X1 [Colias croceus]
MVLIEQISALIDFLENHQDLALGYCSRTNEGRSLSKRYWMECAQILNSISVDCPNKTPAEWRTFYNEYKSKTLKKIKSQKSEISATGGGPAKKISLTPLQERLYSILGRDVGEPLPGVRHNPLTSVNKSLLQCPTFKKIPVHPSMVLIIRCCIIIFLLN